jgi:hypothetical protein
MFNNENAQGAKSVISQFIYPPGLMLGVGEWLIGAKMP